MAKFHSDSPALVLQDDSGVWADFRDHEFETEDAEVISRLASVEGVQEVDPNAAPAPAEAQAPVAPTPEPVPEPQPEAPVTEQAAEAPVEDPNGAPAPQPEA